MEFKRVHPSGRSVDSRIYIFQKVSKMISSVQFNSKEDLLKFSELASKENFNIYISTEYGQLDAKSLLALFTILGKEVNIVAPDHADAKQFASFLSKFAAMRP